MLIGFRHGRSSWPMPYAIGPVVPSSLMMSLVVAQTADQGQVAEHAGRGIHWPAEGELVALVAADDVRRHRQIVGVDLRALRCDGDQRFTCSMP